MPTKPYPPGISTDAFVENRVAFLSWAIQAQVWMTEGEFPGPADHPEAPMGGVRLWSPPSGATSWPLIDPERNAAAIRHLAQEIEGDKQPRLQMFRRRELEWRQEYRRVLGILERWRTVPRLHP